MTLPVYESPKKHDAIDPELAMKIAELLISTENTCDKKQNDHPFLTTALPGED